MGEHSPGQRNLIDRQLLRIAEDGAISPEEEAQVDGILRDLEYLTKVFAEVRLAAERG